MSMLKAEGVGVGGGWGVCVLGKNKFILENTSKQRKMAPEVFCKLDVNSFTWPENQKKGGKQGKENQLLPFSTVRESILPKG